MPTAKAFDPTIHLTPRDVSVDNPSNPTVLKIHLKYLKTDQSRESTDLYIGRAYNCLCPVVALLLYLAVRGMD